MLLAIFHIREPCALNTISNIIGLAVAAGHRPPDANARAGAHGAPEADANARAARRRPTLARPGLMAGLLQTRNARAGGWVDGADARTPTPEARHGLGESEIAEGRRLPPPPLPPRRGSLLGSASGSWDGWAGGPQRIVILNPPLEERLGEHARGAGA